jgi:hypothetical protein
MKPNEARILFRLLAALLAIASWLGVCVFSYAVIHERNWRSDLLRIVLASLVLALVASSVAVRGFVPPWLFRLIPYASSGVSREDLREK